MTTPKEADRLAEECKRLAESAINACGNAVALGASGVCFEAGQRAMNEKAQYVAALHDAIDRLRDLSRNPSVEGDAARLDHLQKRGATVEMLPGGHGGWFFRIGGLHAAVHANIRMAIDAAMAATPKEPR